MVRVSGWAAFVSRAGVMGSRFDFASPSVFGFCFCVRAGA